MVHFDAFKHDGTFVFEDVDFDTALGGDEEGLTDLVADGVIAPDIHVDVDGGLGLSNFAEDTIEGGDGGGGRGICGVVEERWRVWSGHAWVGV